MPKISVIVPVYKVEPYLARCVDSILAQTFTDFELILVDDGSPDNCGVICDEYARADNRIHVIHQKNAGLSAARNAGIDWVFANSNSEWLSFIDSDDWVHPQYLSMLFNMAIEYSVQVSVCGYQETDGIVRVEEQVKMTALKWHPENFFVQHRVNAIIAWGKLYKKECFVKLRYPEGRVNEDEFITYKILFELSEIVATDIPLYYYFRHQNSIMGSKWSIKRLDVLDALEEQITFFEVKSFKQAHKLVCWVYMDCLVRAIYEMINVKIESKYVVQLRGKLRKAIRKHRKVLQIKFSTNSWIYECAYPKSMWLYLKIKAIRGKIRRN